MLSHRNMHTPWLRFVLPVLLVTACGDSTSERFPSDIERNVTLDSLGDSAYQRLCSTFEGWVYDQYAASPMVQAVCTAIAVESTETAGECGEALQQCLENPPPQATAILDEILSQASCEAVAIEPDGCTSTVGQIQDCLDSLSSELDRIELTLTCAAAGQTLEPDWWRIQVPSECMALQTEC